MKVALVTYGMLWGGMETFLLRLGTFLLRHGFEVDVVTTSEMGDWFGKLGRAGLGARYLHRESLTEAGHALRVGRFLARSRYDVIFLNHARHAQLSLALLPDSVIVIPILHNDSPEIYDVACANSAAWNVLVGVSPKLCREAERRLGPHRVACIGYGVEVPSWDHVESTRCHGSTFRLIFAGRLVNAQKGVLLLPEVLEHVVHHGIDVELHIVGEGIDGEPLENDFRRRSILSRVHFHGLKAPAEVYDMLLQSDALLMPSYYEGLPIIMLEAMACGCVPIVSSLAGITDTVVKEGCSGFLVPPGEARQFARAVIELAQSPDRWREMSVRAYQEASRRSVEVMGTAYLHLIECCCAGQYPLLRRRRFQLPLDRTLLRLSDLRPHLPEPRRLLLEEESFDAAVERKPRSRLVGRGRSLVKRAIGVRQK